MDLPGLGPGRKHSSELHTLDLPGLGLGHKHACTFVISHHSCSDAIISHEEKLFGPGDAPPGDAPPGLCGLPAHGSDGSSLLANVDGPGIGVSCAGASHDVPHWPKGDVGGEPKVEGRR